MLVEEKLMELLLDKEYTITTVESCTGGLLMGTILNVSGASQCVNAGYITYSNDAKERIVGVKKKTLESFGAVSKETAREMAIGGARVANANVSIGVTGIAGPSGGTQEKPVGLVYIACFVNGEIEVRAHQFEGRRDMVRAQSINEAMKLAIYLLEKES